MASKIRQLQTDISGTSALTLSDVSGVANTLDGILSGVLTTHFHSDIDAVSGALYSQLSSVSGVLGPSGAQGPQGIAGPSGAQGLQGIAGPSGATGATGPAGSGTVDYSVVSGIAIGLDQALSGTLDSKIWASGSIVTYIDNVSGTLNNKILDSGSIVTAIANASGAAVISASGGAVNVAHTELVNASGAIVAQIGGGSTNIIWWMTCTSGDIAGTRVYNMTNIMPTSTVETVSPTLNNGDEWFSQVSTSGTVLGTWPSGIYQIHIYNTSASSAVDVKYNYTLSDRDPSGNLITIATSATWSFYAHNANTLFYIQEPNFYLPSGWVFQSGHRLWLSAVYTAGGNSKTQTLYTKGSTQSYIKLLSTI